MGSTIDCSRCSSHWAEIDTSVALSLEIIIFLFLSLFLGAAVALLSLKPTPTVPLICAFLCFATVVVSGANEQTSGHDHAGHDHAGHADHGKDTPTERLLDLHVRAEVKRDGSVVVERELSIFVNAESSIQRGPCLNLLTVFEGPGGLILDREMQFTKVLRNGKEEPFLVEQGDGQLQLFCGSHGAILEEGVHRYLVQYTAIGDWVYRSGMAIGAFDVTGPFPGFSIEEASLTVTLPEGERFDRFSPALSGLVDEGPAYRADHEGGVIKILSNGPMTTDHVFFLNAVWTTGSFASTSHWLEIMDQHPKLPLAEFSAFLLFAALIGIVARSIRSRSPKAVGTNPAPC